MLSFVSNILSGFNQASNYKTQAALLRSNARAAQSAANASAANTMRAAAANWELESDKRKSVREQQTSAVASARNARSGSGFTNQGTGATAENVTRTAFDETIANMARSAAIDYNNYFTNAESTKTQARMQREAAESQARQYEIAANASRKSSIIGGVTGLAGAVVGYKMLSGAAEDYNTTNATAIVEGKLTALNPTAMGILGAGQFAGDFTNLSMSFNPFTSSLTRKNNWDTFASIALGNTPGFQHSEFSI